MEEIIELLRGTLTVDELERIEKAPFREREHPLRRLLRWQTSIGAEYGNTLFALKTVLKSDPEWLTSKRRKERLLDVHEYHNPAGVLAELRTYGSLLMAGFEARPVPETSTRTPDFEVDGPEDSVVEVEVFAKSYPVDEAKSLEAFYNMPPPSVVDERVAVREHTVRPFKANGVNLSHPAVVAKILSMKKQGEQLSGSCPGILWLDLQGELWQLYPWTDSCLPITVDRNGFHSGGLWYAFFGQENDPIFERHIPWPFDQRVDFAPGICSMSHSGRFKQDRALSGVVVSSDSFLALFENPDAVQPLEEWFWRRATALRWFDISRSWIGWPAKDLPERLAIERRRLHALMDLREPPVASP